MSLTPLDTSFSAIVDRLLGNLGPGIDKNAGSMARTLAESYGREMATFYAMLELAHRSGYLDTAEGAALDNVVAVLGISRARAGRLTGDVEFSRNSPAPEDIGIPAGRQVTGVVAENKPLPLFETMEDAVLRRGETRVVIPVQEVEDESDASKNAPPTIDPGKLNVMPRPVLGIEAVTNRAPIRHTGQDETDASLRARARTALRDGEKGTLESIAAAVRQQGVQQVTVREPPDAPPGVIEVLVGDPDFEHQADGVQLVERAIRESKAAGIRVRLSYARTLYLRPGFQVEPVDPDLDEAGFDRLRRELQQALASFVESVPAGELLSRRKLEAILFSNPAVRHVSDITVRTYVWDSQQKTLADGPRRELGLDWKFRPDEKPTIDVDRMPPDISRARPLVYRLELVVSLPNSDRRTPEQVRQSLRGAVEVYSARITADAQATKKPQAEVVWDALRATLRKESGVEEVLSATLTTDSGLSLSLEQTGPRSARTVPLGVQLALGNVELVGLG
ncbi:baseplate J/gp47 family protein [Pyxidicoccus sp. 3LG]